MQDDKKPFQKWFQTKVSLEQLEGVAHTLFTHDQPQSSLPADVQKTLFEPSNRQFVLRKFHIAGAALGIAMVGAAWILSSFYMTKVSLAGTTVPARSSDTVLAAAFTTSASNYRLTVTRPDGATKQYKLEQLGLSLDKAASVKNTRQQLGLAERAQWWKPVPAVTVVTADNGRLNSFLATEISVTAQPAKDAVLSIENGEIKIADAVAGKQYGIQQPQKTILASARSLQSSTLKLKTLTLNPPLTAEVLEPYKVQLEKTINQPVSFTIAQRTLKPSRADVASWLEITPDEKTKKVDIVVNSGKVQEYINSNAASYVYPAKAQIVTKQSDGSEKILVAGVNGVDVINKADAAATVAKDLLAGDGMNLPLAVSHESFKTITTGSYDKWIEVDLTHKRMYAYEKDRLVKTELVTAGAPSTPTVIGQYAIYAKYGQQDMRGNNVDGSRYFQPNVRWISYFYQDYAIHGNYWRPLSYFGNINSSHGCVSLVDTEAEWMYSWAPIGTPVIVHL